MPAGQQHRINSGGNTYGCDTHNLLTATNSTAYNADYYAIDFEFSLDEQVSGVSAGTVIVASDQGDGYGNKVVLDHGGSYYSVYAHLNGFAVAYGATVAQGQLLGYAGGSGGYPVHLHMQMQLGMAAFKPENMSNVLDIRGGQTFGQYGACPVVASPLWTSVTPTWHGWIYWGAYADKSPIAVSYADDRPDHTHMAARTGSDIWVRNWNGAIWTSWQNLSSNPADPSFNGNVAVSNHYGRIYIVAAASNSIWLKYWDGSTWIGWQNLGGPITGSLAISYGSSGRIDIIGVASNKAWQRWYDGTWHGWDDLSGTSPITGSVAVANRGGLIHVVGWSGGKAWLKWWNGSGWYGWQDLVSAVDGSLAIDNMNAIVGNTSSTQINVHIVAMAGGNAWLRCWDNSDDCNPTGWLNLGGPLAGPLAVTNQNAQIRVVAKDSGSNLWHKWRG